MGLQEWARKELQKRNLQDLALAIRVAEGLMDYGESSSTTKYDKTSKETLGPMKKISRGRWVGKGKEKLWVR
jgi:hypothetical protein